MAAKQTTEPSENNPQVGDNVTFKIGFNYRGWLAIDLVK